MTFPWVSGVVRTESIEINGIPDFKFLLEGMRGTGYEQPLWWGLSFWIYCSKSFGSTVLKKNYAFLCECHNSKQNFLPHLLLKLLKWLHFPSKNLFYMYKCWTLFHCNSVSFLPDCPTCSEFETLWQTVQDLKEQVANNKMQSIIIVRILAKYRNPAGLSRKKRYLTIPPFSRFVDYRTLLSVSYEIFRNVKRRWVQ